MEQETEGAGFEDHHRHEPGDPSYPMHADMVTL
jgi:hypothetical protein